MDRTIDVSTARGTLRGRAARDHDAFLGVPYALPPVGRRRFRAPEPAPAWEGLLWATECGPICPQVRDSMDALLGAGDQPQSEPDCLSLNIWRPRGATNENSLPVLVWIHGGALVGGASSWEQYSGEAFARDGAIMVGINYRLHALGFLDLASHFPAMPDAVNLGLQDVALALRWVHDNIAAFGGDPRTITVFGESAGGGLASALLGYRPAAGLFSRAIIQSGTAVVLHDRDAAAAIAANALREWGVEPGDRASLEAVPIDRILATTDAMLMTGVGGLADFPWIPTRDPDGLDLDAREAVEAGRADAIELVLGWTVDEYRLRWLAQEPCEPAVPLRRIAPAAARRAHELYAARRPTASSSLVEEKIVNDQHFLAPAIALADAHARRGGVCRIYEFRWPSPVLGGRLGACHALELPFVFDRSVAPAFHGAEMLPAKLVSAMHLGWIALASGEAPMVGAEKWGVYGPESQTVAVFDAEPSVGVMDSELSQFWLTSDRESIGIA